MASGFVPAGAINTDEPTSNAESGPSKTEDSWAAAESAIKLARWQQENSSYGEAGNEKSLYEILQANKARKQEEFEERLKFKNQFKNLDEDDVEFLDSIMTDQARTEMLQKKELQAQLDEFRKAQYETELQMAGGSTTSLENLPKVEDIVVGGWKASGRKRKKAVSKSDANTGGVGLPMKIRKTSSAGEKAEGSAGGEKDTAISAQPTKVASDTNGPDKESMRPSEPPSIVALASVNTAKNPDPETHPLNPKTATSNSNPSGGGLLGGLVTYSSEEDDD